MAAATSLSSIESTKPRLKRHHLIKRVPEQSVDETLFGPPARFQMMSGDRTWTASTNDQCLLNKKDKHKSDVVEVVTKDLIRNLKVPLTPDPSGMSVILEHGEYNRLKYQAIILSPTELTELQQKKKQERSQKMDDSNNRKKMMQELENERKRNIKPSDLEQEEVEHGAVVRATAKQQLEENDDEIKNLNTLLLNAKCHAIRDKQLDEKTEMKHYTVNEEKRLDSMMEVERLKSIKEYEERERERHIQQLHGAEIIHKQIEEREIQRQLDKERKEQETQQLLKYIQRLQEEDWNNLQKKRETQHVLMHEVTKCNEEIKQQKKQLKEQEKQEDMKILEYVKRKEAREEQIQKELEQQKHEKELEVARLRAQQEKVKDKQAERDALRAKRNQEEREREWRRKEKEDAQRKADTDLMLKNAREVQVHNKEHFLAVQAQRDRAEFERVLKLQQEKIANEEKLKKELESKKQQHASEVRKQVKEKEEELIAERKNYFMEGHKLRQEAKERRDKLNEIKQRKLSELRAAGIPEKYCAEISRKITAPPPFITH